MAKAAAGQAAIAACIDAIEICGAHGSHRDRARAAREVVPRHQGLRHLRGHREHPAVVISKRIFSDLKSF